jgi:hypothetical protein
MPLHPDRWKTCQLKACGAHQQCCQLPCMHTMIKTPKGLRFPNERPQKQKLPGVAVSGGVSKILPLPPPPERISLSSGRIRE